MALVGAVADEALCLISLSEPSEEELESSPLSTSIGSPINGQCEPRDVVWVYSRASFPAVDLSKLPGLPGVSG